MRKIVLVLGLVITLTNNLVASSIILFRSGPQAPRVSLLRDDRVATLELDYQAGNPWTPFDVGEDGLGPVGYRVRWAPLRANRELDKPYREKITSLRRTQLQPLENDELYWVRVEFVNRLGQIVGDFAYGLFRGGDGRRVEGLRQAMTGFFDDFNQPEGLPEELDWNTTFSQTNDPEFQAFFVNSQFHTHTLVGTPRRELFGDRGQTTHRVRHPLVLGPGETRRIVFDIDGVHLGNRAIWYMDIVSEESEITSHVDVGGGSGFRGHPSPGIRFELRGQFAAVYSLNQRGEQLLLEENRSLDFAGVQTFPNVRRAVEIELSETTVSMNIDGVRVLDTTLGSSSLSAGEYTLHWTAFGYNTLKIAMPYFLIHWDNFGFDGPAPDSVVHNYRSRVRGTDLVRSNDYDSQEVEIHIPDDLSPIDLSKAQARLVFVRQMDNWDYAAWSPADSVSVNGVPFAIQEPVSVAQPPLPLDELINSNAAYSSYIPLGSVGPGGTSPLRQGINRIHFQALKCAFHNVPSRSSIQGEWSPRIRRPKPFTISQSTLTS